MLSETQYQMIDEKCQGASIDAIWSMLDPVHYSWTGLDNCKLEVFNNRRDVFLWIVERHLREGRIKLHKKGVFLESSIEEQVQAFRDAWPKSEEASGYEDFYWWFFDDDCPADVAWRRPDGSYVIAD